MTVYVTQMLVVLPIW